MDFIQTLFDSGNIAAGVSILMACVFLRHLSIKDKLMRESQLECQRMMVISQKKYQEQLDRIADDFSGQIRRMNENLARIETKIDVLK